MKNLQWEAYKQSDPMNCILEPQGSYGGLYLGNIDAAEDVDGLLKQKIGAVLTVAARTNLSYDKQLIPNHQILHVDDVETQDLTRYFNQIINFIQNNINQTNVFVHCFAGVSRSSTAVIVYLMKTFGWSYEKAFKYTQYRRQIINPNKGFVYQMKQFEQTLQNPKIESQTISFSNQLDHQFSYNRNFSSHSSNSTLKNRFGDESRFSALQTNGSKAFQNRDFLNLKEQPDIYKQTRSSSVYFHRPSSSLAHVKKYILEFDSNIIKKSNQFLEKDEKSNDRNLQFSSIRKIESEENQNEKYFSPLHYYQPLSNVQSDNQVQQNTRNTIPRQNLYGSSNLNNLKSRINQQNSSINHYDFNINDYITKNIRNSYQEQNSLKNNNSRKQSIDKNGRSHVGYLSLQINDYSYNQEYCPKRYF